MTHFVAPYAPNDETLVPMLIDQIKRTSDAESRINTRASHYINAIRASAGKIGGLEDFLRDYGLSTKEGLALMVMAEALLRVPDPQTQDDLIEDKIGAGNWTQLKTQPDTWFVTAATWGLGLSTRIVRPGETPDNIIAATTKRIGVPAVRQGVRQAMRFLGHQFVLGQTIQEALKNGQAAEKQGDRHSYDMLGEGARTWDDAHRYGASYAAAIQSIGQSASDAALPNRPGISVKLSALHPRFEARNRDAVLGELVPVVLELAQSAKSYDLNFTIDAEEQDRLELSLDVINAVFADPSLRGWDGFGLAIQAYAKRALPVIDWVVALAQTHNARMMVRLVKGAYWDAEVKHAQLEGVQDYPVFTRKPATDVSYLACAKRMLENRQTLFPQFATHNALTVATIIEMADSTGTRDGFEFQRLHGMGEELYAEVRKADAIACRIYAPVGGHRDLLAYLVRRLLENGANSSFVARIGDKSIPVSELLERPSLKLDEPRHPAIALPAAIFGSRKNSKGIEFGSRQDLNNLVTGMQSSAIAPPVDPFNAAMVDDAMTRAQKVFPAWRDTPVNERADILRKAADGLEDNRDALMATLAQEAGKTIDDGISEIREAVDFLRYYGDEAATLCQSRPLPGPVGEDNIYTVSGRGVWVTIAPWNFPLAIFLGQTAAALATGNCVLAKPAPQTPMIGAQAVAILHAAGVPTDALQLAPGGTDVGQALVNHPLVAGVAFTGSTATAKHIERALAAKDGPIVPLVAETGGINAMIADATALPEQVADDVVTSAFRSAGQRCSACRILYVQDDVADRIMTMIKGAADTLRLGNPSDPATDVGPIIDAASLARLEAHVKSHDIYFQGDRPDGTFMPPTIIELKKDQLLTEEIFGPILHVKRFAAADLDSVIDEINATGFGLTFGVHSRIDARVHDITQRIEAGNLYVNRNQIGAVVGSQPFGGHGRSGTGPKAGGPLYLTRFVQERVVSTDTTAAGGNATLIAIEDTA